MRKRAGSTSPVYASTSNRMEAAARATRKEIPMIGRAKIAQVATNPSMVNVATLQSMSRV